MKQSKLFLLNWHDALKGVLIAGASGGMLTLQQYLDNNMEPIDWKIVLGASISAMIAYILKQLFTNNEGKLLTKSPKDDNSKS